MPTHVQQFRRRAVCQPSRVLRAVLRSTGVIKRLPTLGQFPVTSLHQFRVLFVTSLVPRLLWYWAALAISRFEATFEGLIRYRKTDIGQAARLHDWIRELTKFGPFPIPSRVVGMDILEAARARGRGVLVCSTHIPLFDLALSVLVQQGCIPDLMLAATRNKTNGAYQIPAGSGTVAAATADASVLLKVRTELRGGGFVGCLLDRELDGPLFGNVLRLAGKVASPLLFWSVKVGADGFIEVLFEDAPFPMCETEEAVRANLAVVESSRASYLNSIQRRN